MRIFVKWGRFFINFSHFILLIQIFFVPLHHERNNNRNHEKSIMAYCLPYDNGNEC